MTIQAQWLQGIPTLRAAADPIPIAPPSDMGPEAAWWASALTHAAGLQTYYEIVDPGRFATWTEDALRSAWAGLLPIAGPDYCKLCRSWGQSAGRRLDGGFAGPEVGWWAEGLRVSWGLCIVLGMNALDHPGWTDHPAFSVHRRFRMGLLNTVIDRRTQNALVDRINGSGAWPFLEMAAARQLVLEAGA